MGLNSMETNTFLFLSNARTIPSNQNMSVFSTSGKTGSMTIDSLQFSPEQFTPSFSLLEDSLQQQLTSKKFIPKTIPSRESWLLGQFTPGADHS